MQLVAHSVTPLQGKAPGPENKGFSRKAQKGVDAELALELTYNVSTPPDPDWAFLGVLCNAKEELET